MARQIGPLGYKTMKSSRVIKEAPEGPTMTETEFKAAMDDLPTDAARWRWLRRNWSHFFEYMLNRPQAAMGSEMQAIVDRMRA